MKLKKKHFKKLKEIAVAINRLDKLIAEIELVHRAKEEFSLIEINQLQKDLGSQKLKTEEEIYAMHRKDVDANFLKEGKAMVAASTDKGTTFKVGLRDTVESVTNHNEISDLLDSALVLSNKDPKIGDVGYFYNTDPNYAVIYGKLRSFTGDNYQNQYGNWFKNFSKTPPELK